MADVEQLEPAAGGPASSGLPCEDGAEVRLRLTRAVSRICPSWLADAAEDIVQCAWIKVAERRGEGAGALPASYLWQVAYSATVDEIRRRRRRREVGMDETSIDAPAETAQTDPERVCAGSEIGQGLRDCLRGLAEPRRLAVVLHLQGHTVPEAGRILGWGAKRVENLVYRGLDDLRRCLRAKGLGP